MQWPKKNWSVLESLPDRHDADRMSRNILKPQKQTKHNNLHQETPSLLAVLRKTVPVQCPNAQRKSGIRNPFDGARKESLGLPSRTTDLPCFQTGQVITKSSSPTLVKMKCGHDGQSFPSGAQDFGHGTPMTSAESPMTSSQPLTLAEKAKIWIAVWLYEGRA